MMKVSCMNCGHEFPLVRTYVDEIGLHTVCPKCGSSFDIDAEVELNEEQPVRNDDLDDKVLEYLWEEFGDVLIDDNECILDDFIGFKCGTHREEVWHWFDEHHSKGVSFLMFGEEP